MAKEAGPSTAGSASAEARPELLHLPLKNLSAKLSSPPNYIKKDVDALVRSERPTLEPALVEGERVVGLRNHRWNEQTKRFEPKEGTDSDGGTAALADGLSAAANVAGSNSYYKLLLAALDGYCFKDALRVVALAESLARRVPEGQSVQILHRNPETGAEEIFRQIAGRAKPTANRGTKRVCSMPVKEPCSDLEQCLLKRAELSQAREEAEIGLMIADPEAKVIENVRLASELCAQGIRFPGYGDSSRMIEAGTSMSTLSSSGLAS